MPERGQFEIRGTPLVCPQCYGKSFTRRHAVVEAGFGLTRAAENYECDECGYVFWFLNR